MERFEAIKMQANKAIISFGLPTKALTIHSNFTGKQKADISNEVSAFFLSLHLKGVKK